MLTFLKLGGSLITDKSQPYTARPKLIEDLAVQIAAAMKENPDLQIILGHGSGSFGHQAAARYDTRQGVSGLEGWRGFSEVWYQASLLNRMVVDALRKAGLPALGFSPASSVTAHDGKVFIWDIYPLQSALTNGLLPVIHGDVAFDEVRGGTILSTEELFIHLTHQIQPQRILLAGRESWVWMDFPDRTTYLEELTPEELESKIPDVGEAAGADVTGGMRSKIAGMLTLVEEMPELEVFIFSGLEPDNIRQALLGEKVGTHLHR